MSRRRRALALSFVLLAPLGLAALAGIWLSTEADGNVERGIKRVYHGQFPANLFRRADQKSRASSRYVAHQWIRGPGLDDLLHRGANDRLGASSAALAGQWHYGEQFRQARQTIPRRERRTRAPFSAFWRPAFQAKKARSGRSGVQFCAILGCMFSFYQDSIPGASHNRRGTLSRLVDVRGRQATNTDVAGSRKVQQLAILTRGRAASGRSFRASTAWGCRSVCDRLQFVASTVPAAAGRTTI